MKKKYLLYILFVSLLAITIVSLLNRKSGTFKGGENQFAVKDTGSIDIIEIRSHENTVILERMQGRWMVNGHYSASNKKIGGLLMIISRLQVSAPVPGAIKYEITGKLKDEGKRLMVVTDRKSPHVIFMYHDTVYTYTTYMMLEDSDQPFRVGIPGYPQKNMSGLFVDEPGYWRDNSIFRLNGDEIISVSMYNGMYPDRSFYLVNNGDSGYKLYTYSDSVEIKDFVNEQVRQYLSYFSSVSFERFLSDEEKTDQPGLKEAKPDNIITLTDSRNNVIKVETYRWYDPGQEGQPVPDLNRLIAIINDTDVVVARYVELDPPIKDIGYFLEKEKNNLYN
jgi:hypothetical protein